MAEEKKLESFIKQQLAISEALYKVAEKLDFVVSFRKRFLDEKLVEYEKIESWLQSKIKHPSKSLGTITFVVELKENVVTPEEFEKITKAIGKQDNPLILELLSKKASDVRISVNAKKNILSYPYPGEEFARTIPFSSDVEELVELKEASKRLLELFPWWKEYQAVAFILSGKKPYSSHFSVTKKISGTESGLVRGTVLIKSSPFIPPELIEKNYKKARQKLLEEVYGKRRAKPISEKHLEIALFALEKSEMSWDEMFREWNRKHPDKKEWRNYYDRRNFARDALRAIETLEKIAGVSFDFKKKPL